MGGFWESGRLDWIVWGFWRGGGKERGGFEADFEDKTQFFLKKGYFYSIR